MNVRKAIEKEGICVQKIFLYGSYSRGEERKYSDIDLAVVSRDFEEDTIEANMKLWRIAVRVDVRLAPLAIAQSELVNLHIPIIAEAQKGVDMTTEAA
jgi:predicted nucleotidyltransferase